MAHVSLLSQMLLCNKVVGKDQGFSRFVRHWGRMPDRLKPRIQMHLEAWFTTSTAYDVPAGALVSESYLLRVMATEVFSGLFRRQACQELLVFAAVDQILVVGPVQVVGATSGTLLEL